jgi:hypothetical protein
VDADDDADPMEPGPADTNRQEGNGFAARHEPAGPWQ